MAQHAHGTPQFVQWDETTKRPVSFVRELPVAVAKKRPTELAGLGYRPLEVRMPEDHIPRFVRLLGNPAFDEKSDGTVVQTFPDADFSEARVRETLKEDIREEARRRLSLTDWYVVRGLEQGTPVPEPIKRLRQKQRDAVTVLSDAVDDLPARKLVDFTWRFPTDPDDAMIDGVPVRLSGGVVQAPHPEGSQAPLSVQGEIPPTTDGPTPTLSNEEMVARQAEGLPVFVQGAIEVESGYKVAAEVEQ